MFFNACFFCDSFDRDKKQDNSFVSDISILTSMLQNSQQVTKAHGVTRGN